MNGCKRHGLSDSSPCYWGRPSSCHHRHSWGIPPAAIKGAILQHVGWIPVEHCCCIHLLQLPKPNSLGRSACLVKVRYVHWDCYCNLSLLNYRGKNIKLGWQGKCLTMGSAEGRHGVKFAQHCLERRCRCCSYQLYFKGTQRVGRALHSSFAFPFGALAQQDPETMPNVLLCF